jgi:hypothetical protein
VQAAGQAAARAPGRRQGPWGGPVAAGLGEVRDTEAGYQCWAGKQAQGLLRQLLLHVLMSTQLMRMLPLALQLMVGTLLQTS